MAYGFNDDKSKYDLNNLLMGLTLKRYSGSATTLPSGSINLGGLGISTQTDVPIVILAANSQYPNGLFTELTTINNNYWIIVKDNNGNKIASKAITLYIFYLSSKV